MDFRMRISLFCCLAACVFMVAVPLVSEATYRGRGSEAGKPFDTQIIYVDTLPSETSPDEDGSDDSGNDSINSETVSPAPDAPFTVTVLDTSTGENVEMSLEDYIACVVAAEMPYTFHTEALKAQAVAARSYCLYKMENGLTHEGGADVCTGYSHCAAYVTEAELIAKYGEKTAKRITKKIREAVEATAGEIITYKGKPALALFHARSWQFTESSENVWGGKLPYLVSVSTPEEDSISTVTVTDGELKALFASSSAIEVTVGKAGKLTSEKNDTGRQAYLFYGNKGIKAKKLRSLLGFRSCRFEYQKADEGWLFTIHGYGHGVGMSQYGANTMAIGGADYRDILTHYYTGVSITTLSP
jgi:stage II sporulation protein D